MTDSVTVLQDVVPEIESMWHLCYDEASSNQQPDKVCRVCKNTTFLALCHVQI